MNDEIDRVAREVIDLCDAAIENQCTNNMCGPELPLGEWCGVCLFATDIRNIMSRCVREVRNR